MADFVVEVPTNKGSKFGAFRMQGNAEDWRDKNQPKGVVRMVGKMGRNRDGSLFDNRRFWVFVKEGS